MPQLIDHIDAIARKEQRDVLYVLFHARANKTKMEWRAIKHYNYEKDRKRQALCDWLDAKQISWRPCAHYASENMMCSYLGQIYINVPYDENNSTYQLLRDHLENPDGTMRDPHIMFCYLPLAEAMKNAHHDEPGFWERWAENF